MSIYEQDIILHKYDDFVPENDKKSEMYGSNV